MLRPLALPLLALLAPLGFALPQAPALGKQDSPDLPREAIVPAGFVDELVLGGFTAPVGLLHDANERLYVWDKGGRVWVIENGQRVSPPLIDLSEEVGNWRDFGLLGVALDPDFLVNGYLYLYYVVDRHHLLNFGTPSYSSTADEYFAATIGRITRYTADAGTGFKTTDPASRKVLLGETPETGVPILHQSHGTGALLFGEDGSLLASSGDGASYSGVDVGSFNNTYWSDGLADGIIRSEENVGSFRSQMLESHNGKILRIDPATGDGLPSNPFYEAADPRSPRSRTWALGLRNPFRFSLIPGTGSSSPSIGRPGELLVGDVGWGTWEELHLIDEPGMNLGWPLFEGLTAQGGYTQAVTENRDAPNPLFGSGGCSRAYFTFQELLAQEQKDHNPAFPNPCNTSQSIAPATPTFMHHRPLLEWRHGSSPQTRVPIFNGNLAATAGIGTSGSPVLGTPFTGNCAVGGFQHSGLGFPAPYAGVYFVADFSHNWIRALRFEDDHLLEEVLDFATANNPVALAEEPASGSLLYLEVNTGQLRRIRYNGTANQPPLAALDADRLYGASPLTVRFDASRSVDPEGAPLTFEWDFGDGGTSTKPSPVHQYSAGSGNPSTRTVTLTTRDPGGVASVQTELVHLDNTPPEVEITSVASGSFYSTTVATNLSLVANVTDAEHSSSELDYAWQVFLAHNTHQHPEPIDTNPQTSVVLSPTPCSGEFYAYRIHLSVTDAEGLVGEDEVWLYPDCNASASVDLVSPSVGTSVLPRQVVTLQAAPGGSWDHVDFYADDERIGSRSAAPFTLDWTALEPGTVTFTALVIAADGTSSAAPGVTVEVLAPMVQRISLNDSLSDTEERLSSGRVRTASSDLELGADGSNPQLVGMRFPVSLPPGTFISNAYVQFYSDEKDSKSTSLVIQAERDRTPRLLTSIGSDLSVRPRTNASVVWEPEPWSYVHARGPRQRTPNLAPIIEELVNISLRQSPSAILLLVSGTGERTAESANGSSNKEPELVIEYGTGLNVAPFVDAGPDTTAALGAPVSLAGQVADDGLPSGTLTSLWTRVSGPGSVSFADATAPTTTATLSNAGTYVLRLTADDGELTSFDDVQVTVITGSTQTTESTIAVDADDAEERLDSGSVTRSSSDLELGYDGSRSQLVGMRFVLDVPQGALITNAYVQFTVDESNSQSTELDFAIEAADDASRIDDESRELSMRATTGTLVHWSPPAWSGAGTAGPDQRTPDLQALIQDIVDRPGWNPGQHVLLLVSGTGERTAESRDGSTSKAPRLHVEYQ